MCGLRDKIISEELKIIHIQFVVTWPLSGDVTILGF